MSFIIYISSCCDTMRVHRIAHCLGLWRRPDMTPETSSTIEELHRDYNVADRANIEEKSLNAYANRKSFFLSATHTCITAAVFSISYLCFFFLFLPYFYIYILFFFVLYLWINNFARNKDDRNSVRAPRYRYRHKPMEQCKTNGASNQQTVPAITTERTTTTTTKTIIITAIHLQFCMLYSDEKKNQNENAEKRNAFRVTISLLFHALSTLARTNTNNVLRKLFFALLVPPVPCLLTSPPPPSVLFSPPTHVYLYNAIVLAHRSNRIGHFQFGEGRNSSERMNELHTKRKHHSRINWKRVFIKRKHTNHAYQMRKIQMKQVLTKCEEEEASTGDLTFFFVSVAGSVTHFFK